MPSSAVRLFRSLSLVTLAVILVGVFLAPDRALAQDTVGPEVGLKPYGSFHGGEIDSISMANLKLNLRIPLFSDSQRGGKLHLGFYIAYHNPTFTPTVDVVNHITYKDWSVDSTGVQIFPDFTLVTGCNPTSCFYQAYEPDGVVHHLGQLSSGNWISMDATGYAYNPSTSVLTDREGVRYTTQVVNQQSYLSQIEDPNGNKITSTVDSAGRVLNWTDTLGRSIPAPPLCTDGSCGVGVSTTDFSYCTGPLPITKAFLWTVPGPSGVTQNIKTCIASVHIVAFSNCGTNCTGVNQSEDAIQSIVLPGLNAWTFQYDNGGFGDLTKITFPTGGSISYAWRNQTIGNQPVNAGTSVTTRAVTSRSADANDGAGAHTWSYSQTIVTSASPLVLKTTVTDPLGSDTVHTMTGLTNTYSVYETAADFYQGSASSGSLINSVLTDYTFAANPYDGAAPFPSAINVAPIRVTTKFANGQVKKVETDYDAGVPMSGSGAGTNAIYGNVVAQREYDYGSGTPGPLLRTTATNYQAFGNSTYLTNNLLTLPSSIQVKDGSAVQRAYTTYGYDEYALNSSAITTQHDSAPPAGSARGNQTSINHWLNTTASYLVSTAHYFDTGTVQTAIDPGNHTTTFAYSSTYVGAFPTTITNALTQSASKSYDFNTGLLTSVTDPNNLSTSYSYDNMWRLTQISHPDGGLDTISRQESSFPFTTTHTKKMNATKNIVTTSVFDGLGRVTQTQVTSDPQGTVFTDTTYDAPGRASTASNPYRSTTEATYGITTTNYDALSRVTKVIPPDGSPTANNVTTSYSGNCTTVTDQTGKSRKSCTDALGRLTQVFEDPAGLNYETDYTYDVLGNLLTVNQKGNDPNSANWRTRTFTYNSLSQLLTASNPESGTISYAYDNDGNLLTKTAPASNQTGAATVTTTFAYDALHRVTQKSFSDTTPTVKYGYDGVAPVGCTPPALAITNGIGRRTAMCDAAGAEAWSYDAMGRALAEQRITSGATKTTSYTYNLDGSVATLTYPSGRTVTYTPSAAGRTLSAVDTANAISYATGALYAPQGALASLTNGASLVSRFFYNSRLQPCRISIKSSGTAPTQCTDTANIANVLDFTYGFNSGTADNGNVISTTNNRDTTRSQSFTYDTLNRIATAQTSATTGTKCWGEQFGYDIWGNLLTIGGLSGYTGCTQENLNIAATTKNQISGDTYDAAGNLTSIPGVASYAYNAENQLASAAGVNYTYDGDGKRVQKSNGKLYWYGVGSDPLDESDAAGNITDEYVFFGGKRIARRHVNAVPPDTVSYYFADHLGTSRVVTDATGTVLDDSDFYPFGGERPIVSSSGNTYKFTSKERDSESGLDNFGARYNSSAMGRFMSPDPKILSIRHIINPQKWNKYAYTINNPLRYFDPNGMEEIEVQLRAFIPQSSVAGFRGDNRGFTTAQNVTSRTSITVRVETDPAKSQNPLLNTPKGVAGQTEFLPTGTTATQTKGLPTADVSRDANGNVVINLKQDASNPLVPGAPPIKSDLTVTIPASGSSVTTAGTVSGSPAFELNVSTEGGTDVNIPLQNAPSSTPGFVTGLPQTNSVLNLTPLPPPPPPPPPCNNNQQTTCPK